MAISDSRGLFVQMAAALKQIRGIDLRGVQNQKEPSDIFATFDTLEKYLVNAGHDREAFTLGEVLKLCTSSSDFGGLGILNDVSITREQYAEVIFLTTAWLEALNSADRAKKPTKPLKTRPPGRRGMTISEKILAMHDIDRRGSVKPGDMVRVDVDWVIASELSWSGMGELYDLLKKPGIFRNDRFWLAGDHVVEPRINHVPKVKKLIERADRAKKEFLMTENQGMNYTIMHTEFFRERAQPGMLVIGSDSHTCSAGAVSALAVGLGVAEVTMSLVTGETWFRVPETVNIRFVGKPPPGVGGKDTILYVLNQFKRNTIAAERFVEYTGPGLQYLSCDARFAICNMTTEFGGVTGICEPDSATFDFINRRGPKRHKDSSVYFRADEDAEYVETFEVDLSKVEPFVAKYPSPDDVVPVSELTGMKLDGCFIGACTTAEEDLIIAAMVLEQGLQRGMKPGPGKRLIVPGSKPIRHRLDALNLTEVFEEAGFTVGLPGCSLCVGIGADKALQNEVWLSSQNRNFKDRMGPGSIAYLSSAATVAASSFGMKVSDPKSLLDGIDQTRLQKYLGYDSFSREISANTGKPEYVEPCETVTEGKPTPNISQTRLAKSQEIEMTQEMAGVASQNLIHGKVNRLGDYIDTDALAPNPALMLPNIGEHCLEYFMPEFRQMVKDGLNVVVGGIAFGCGSSREQAVTALAGCGVQCVIAKSFAFIFARNGPNLGFLEITITDEKFYELADTGVEIHVDVAAREVEVANSKFSFELSPMEESLIEIGGVTPAFERFGKKLFESLCSGKSKKPVRAIDRVSSDGQRSALAF